MERKTDMKHELLAMLTDAERELWRRCAPRVTVDIASQTICDLLTSSAELRSEVERLKTCEAILEESAWMIEAWKCDKCGRWGEDETWIASHDESRRWCEVCTKDWVECPTCKTMHPTDQPHECDEDGGY